MDRRQAAGDGSRTPAAVLHRDGEQYRDALVVVRLEEFAELVGRLSGESPK